MQKRNNMNTPSGHRIHAFTLMETLVVLVILSLLLSIMFPGLSLVRDRSRISRALADLRTHAQVFTAYAQDWKEAWPWFDHFQVYNEEKYISILPGSADICYFYQSRGWNVALAEDYYNLPFWSDVFYAPDTPDDRMGGEATYSYSCTFLADPQYWEREHRTDYHQFRATHVQEVSFPERKVIFGYEKYTPALATDRFYDSIPLVAFVDGSARRMGKRKLKIGYAEYLGSPGDDCNGHFSIWPPGAHTISGLHGTDYD